MMLWVCKKEFKFLCWKGGVGKGKDRYLKLQDKCHEYSTLILVLGQADSKKLTRYQEIKAVSRVTRRK